MATYTMHYRIVQWFKCTINVLSLHSRCYYYIGINLATGAPIQLLWWNLSVRLGHLWLGLITVYLQCRYSMDKLVVPMFIFHLAVHVGQYTNIHNYI